MFYKKTCVNTHHYFVSQFVGLLNTKLDEVIVRNRCQAIFLYHCRLDFVNRLEFCSKMIKFCKKTQLKLKIMHIFVRHPGKPRDFNCLAIMYICFIVFWTVACLRGSFLWKNTFCYGKKFEKKIGTFKVKAFVEYFR